MPKKVTNNRHTGSLIRSIIMRLLVSTIVMSVIFVGVSSYLIYVFIQEEFSEDINILEASLVQLFELPLWDLDDEAVTRTALSYFSNPLVASLVVEDSFGNILFSETKDIETERGPYHAAVSRGDLTVGRITYTVSEPVSTLLLHRIIFLILPLLAIVILTLLVTGNLVLRKTVFRIRFLQEAVSDIAKGNFSRRLIGLSDDEVGKLGEAVNQMAATIEASQQDLSTRVEEKTKQLSALVKKIEAQNQRLEQTKKATLNVMEDMEEDQRELAILSERLSVATSGAGVGIWDWDIVHNVLQWDDQMFALYGTNSSAFSGAYEAWQHGLHPEDRERADKEIQMALTGERNFDTTFRVVWPNGSVHHIKAHGVVRRNEKGEATRMIGVNWDVTAEVRATAQLASEKIKDEAIFASIGDGVIVTDKDGNIILINKAATDALYIEDEDVIGKPIVDIVDVQDQHGAPVPYNLRPTTMALDSGRPIYTTVTDKLFYKSHTGRLFPVAITVSPLIVNGETEGAVVVFRDISEELDIDKAKTEFVSLASHQLRTPLSTISWYVEMLLSGDVGTVTPEQKEYLEQVYASNRRMTDLVNALLNVSRLELGTFAVEVQVTNIIEMAQSVVDEVTPLAKKKKITVTADLAEDVPAIKVDPRLMRMVFQNLLSNAIKYTPDGGDVSLSLSLADREKNKRGGRKEDSILIVVKDNGMGIPKAQHKQIFTKLFRADNVKETDTEGTGLGLYVIKSIIDHSRGTIRFDSEEGKGTTFYVTMPLIGMPEKQGTRALQ